MKAEDDYDYGEGSGKNSRRKPDPWTEAETSLLTSAIAAATYKGGDALWCRAVVDWPAVASAIPGRTSKQCKEKFDNHLRDGLSKDPWSLQEEYVLVSMHSQVGNKWQLISKKFPNRAYNTVKNHWSAATRAKSGDRKRSLLWIYSDLVVHKGYTPAPSTFRKACQMYGQVDGYPSISVFAVDDNHFVTGPGKGQVGLNSGACAPVGSFGRRQVRKAAALTLSASKLDCGDGLYQDYEEEEMEEGEGEEEEEEGEDHDLEWGRMPHASGRGVSPGPRHAEPMDCAPAGPSGTWQHTEEADTNGAWQHALAAAAGPSGTWERTAPLEIEAWQQATVAGLRALREEEGLPETQGLGGEGQQQQHDQQEAIAPPEEPDPTPGTFIEQSVVKTLFTVSQDPALSPEERKAVIKGYMEAIQVFVNIEFDSEM